MKISSNILFEGMGCPSTQHFNLVLGKTSLGCCSGCPYAEGVGREMFGWDAGSVQYDFENFLDPMSGRRKVFVINKQRVERRGNLVNGQGLSGVWAGGGGFFFRKPLGRRKI